MQELQGVSIIWWRLILAGNAKFISTFIEISFVFDPLIVNVRCLLDVLIISICCSQYLLIFSLGYGWEVAKKIIVTQDTFIAWLFRQLKPFIISSFRNVVTSAADPLFIPVMEVQSWLG